MVAGMAAAVPARRAMELENFIVAVG
jgi:hypothetical protein